MAVVSRNRNGFLVAPRRRAAKGTLISICIVNGIYIYDIKRFVGILQRKKKIIFLMVMQGSLMVMVIVAFGE